MPNFNVEEVSINGKRAQLRFYDDNKRPETHPFVYAAYFPDILGNGEGELDETKAVQFMNFPKILSAIFIGSTAVLCTLDKHRALHDPVR